MNEIDFGFIGNGGFTIYRTSFNKYIIARFVLKKSEEDRSKLIPKVEETFFWLVEESQKRLGIKAVNEIIQIPSSSGSTCFEVATACSPKIMKFILNRDVKINSVQTNMTIPWFQYPELAEQMMIKNLNPKVIRYDALSEYERWPNSFVSSKCKALVEKFPRSIYFVTKDTECNNNCPKNCKSKLKAFFFENGSLVDIDDNNQLGSGGFGTVYCGKWHGKDAAMKCIWIDQIPERYFVIDAIDDFEKNISEYRSQLMAKGSGVIIPYAMVRQQNQEYEDGKWISLNFNVLIYPKYDLNLYELHETYYNQYTDEILRDILHQCLTR